MTTEGNDQGKPEIEEVYSLLADFVDSDSCSYDHHGYCQTHGSDKPCRMARARKLLEERNRSSGGCIKHPRDLRDGALVELVRQLQMILYLGEDDCWDAEKEWSPDTLQEIGNLLGDYGLQPRT